MNNLTISVIIPVYNTEKYLGEAIESVLKQTLNPLEIIVVDDDSQDNSLQVAESFGKAIVIEKHSENKGIGASRNTGISRAKGKYLAFLDADDLWVENKLEKQVAFMKENPATNIILGNVRQFISPELPDEHKNKLKGEMENMPGFVAGTMLISVDNFNKVGMFNEKLQLGEFVDWFGRARDLGLKHKLMNEIVLWRRIHTTNVGITKRRHLNDYTAILREALARKRKMK